MVRIRLGLKKFQRYIIKSQLYNLNLKEIQFEHDTLKFQVRHALS